MALLSPLKAPSFWLRVLTILIGSSTAGAGIQVFLAPAKLLPAGLSGLTVLVALLTPVHAGALLLLLNIPIFLLGWRMVDASFVRWSLLGMLGFTSALQWARPLGDLNLINDWYLNAITGAVVVGFGTGLVFRVRASQGGMDIVAAILRRRVGVGIAPLFFGLNAVVVVILAFFYGLQAAVATTLVIWLESLVIEKTIVGIDPHKALFIISDEAERITDTLLNDLKRGVTVLHGRGGWKREEKDVLYCIVTTRQLAHARKLIEGIDPTCFMAVHNVTEVMGLGFRALPI
jgi:uncharacterized membrane-anchored protein YitT (DUF2179 family)